MDPEFLTRLKGSTHRGWILRTPLDRSWLLQRIQVKGARSGLHGALGKTPCHESQPRIVERLYRGMHQSEKTVAS